MFIDVCFPSPLIASLAAYGGREYRGDQIHRARRTPEHVLSKRKLSSGVQPGHVD